MVLYRLTTSLGIVRHVGKKFCATQITFLICVLNCLYYDKDATIYHRRARKNTGGIAVSHLEKTRYKGKKNLCTASL
ncbi:hypothetical protein Y032_0136g1972 [Ancylostoma ceylanicum]|uniref:Uncharacterized protein n=1 Tax=Ancylostoma ceylanicum TaxID=53326 RepID=A0A016T5B2_9BILA|nr:hypothetical protein Y032_0136g1972 [Ancylostoma ceylanicum]